MNQFKYVFYVTLCVTAPACVTEEDDADLETVVRETGWESAVKTRNLAQNEYTRAE